MAKKKSAKNQPCRETFSNSPFKQLKGLTAFDPGETALSGARDGTGCVPVTTSEPADGRRSFTEEMACLGVKPLKQDHLARGEAGYQGASQLPAKLPAENDETIFREALGSMQMVFKDEWPDEVKSKQALPRRMKQLERGQLKPEAELDLHGLTVDEALARVRFFLQNAKHQGVQVALIITGKGSPAKNGSLLGEAIAKLLPQLGEFAIEWGGAPRRYGGKGALIVFLRR